MPLTTMESLAMDLRCDADLLQEAAENLVRIEELNRDRPRRLAVSLVIGQDPLGPGGGFVERAEGHEPLADRQMPAETGVLHQRRLARREIADRAFAAPTAVSLEVDAL